jgi:hypothetical protein
MAAATPAAVVIGHRLAGLKRHPARSVIFGSQHLLRSSSEITPERGPLGPCYAGSEVNFGAVFISFPESKLLTFGSVSLGQAGVTSD